MKRIQQLRNTIVHNGGMPDTSQDLKRITQLVEHMTGVCCEEFGIDFGSDSVPYFLSEMAAFLDEMQAGLKEVCERIRKFENEA